MSMLELDFTGGQVLLPGQGLVAGVLSVAAGKMVGETTGRPVDASGFLILPGIVDMHGDGFERHVAPRRGAMTDPVDGIIATEAELAANGITTGVIAQFWSWEGGLRGPEFAGRIFPAIRDARAGLATTLLPQLRFEISMLDDYAALPGQMADWGVPYIVFNDHLPHDRLAAGKTPPRLTGQALKAGRNPEKHLEMLQELHANMKDVPAALDRLTAELAGQRILMGSHDENRANQRAEWRGRGVRISEFPETEEAARAAREGGDGVILGAPNVMRGGSHKGNVSAASLVALGLCDALASDYHYPSPRRAAFQLAREGACDFATAWGLLSSGPARLMGLSDRGSLQPGQRADLVVIEAVTERVAMTMAGGQVTYLSGAFAGRLLG